MRRGRQRRDQISRQLGEIENVLAIEAGVIKEGGFGEIGHSVGVGRVSRRRNPRGWVMDSSRFILVAGFVSVG
ncbi:hypothetical protein GCM10027046_39130 [Uliginosibacterium flavum]